MTNDDHCVSIDVVARCLCVRRKSTPLPSTPPARHSILLISSQNTPHLTTHVVRRKWLDRLSCAGDRKAALPAGLAATRSGELYKSGGRGGRGDAGSRFRLASRIYCRLVSGWDRAAGHAGRINVVRLKWRTALARQVSSSSSLANTSWSCAAATHGTAAPRRRRRCCCCCCHTTHDR